MRMGSYSRFETTLLVSPTLRYAPGRRVQYIHEEQQL